MAAAAINPNMCAAYRCSRRYQESVFTTHDQSISRPSQPRCNNSNKLHLYKALERGTIDQRRTWEYGDRGKGVLVGLHRDLSSSSLSSCDAALERRKGCANILTDWLQSGSAYAHPSSQASISRRDGEGAMGRFARPRAPREQHRRDTANHRCAWVQVREEDYLV